MVKKIIFGVIGIVVVLALIDTLGENGDSPSQAQSKEPTATRTPTPTPDPVPPVKEYYNTVLTIFKPSDEVNKRVQDLAATNPNRSTLYTAVTNAKDTHQSSWQTLDRVSPPKELKTAHEDLQGSLMERQMGSEAFAKFINAGDLEEQRKATQSFQTAETLMFRGLAGIMDRATELGITDIEQP